jgi:outer membrane protein TolC
MCLPAFAQTDSLPHYLNIAATNSPAVKAAALTYHAAMQKIPQAGALQDPQLDAGFFLQPMEIIDGNQIADVKIMQMFPWFGARKAARTEARHMANMALEQLRETRDNLLLAVYTQWFALCRMKQQLRNNRENKKLLTHLEELALRKFEAPPTAAKGLRASEYKKTADPVSGGQAGAMNMSPPTPNPAAPMPPMPQMSQMTPQENGGMSEVLQIQLEIAEIENNMENILSEIQAGKALFNALLNRPPESAVTLPDTLTQIPFLPDIAAAKTLIASRNPMLNMLSEEASAYQAKAVMDRKMSYPMFGVGLQYMLINKKQANPMTDNGMSAMNSMNGRDMIMPMLSVSIPVYRSKYRAQQRETALLRQASREKYLDAQNMLNAELYRAKHLLDAAARQISLYRKQTALAQTTFDLMIQEFASGKTGLANLIQIQRQLLDYELKTAEAVADYNSTAAGILKLTAGYDE